MENLELIREIFKAINSFKRSRTLYEKYRKEGDEQKALYHELRMFKEFDRIELGVRAIQKNERMKQHQEQNLQHGEEEIENIEEDDEDDE